jgi:septum formation protein
MIDATGSARGRLVLASASPRRLALLAQIGLIPDEIIAPDIDESWERLENPRLYVQRMARGKNAAVETDGFVLAADTVVAVGQRIQPKTETEAEARACLSLLSGRRHRVLTCVVLRAPDGRKAERLCETAVIFHRMSHEQINAYLATGEWQGKAGGYAVQGHAAAHIRQLCGSYSSVVGLPLFETAQLLRGLGYPIP